MNLQLGLKYITTIYSKLSPKQIKKINIFLKDNFDKDIFCKSLKNNFDFQLSTIIILALLENNIIGCICLFNSKYLLEKVIQSNISLSHYAFADNIGFFIYNLCVSKHYRNNKIGFKLTEYAIEEMNKLNIGYLHTQAENEIARKIFINNGFIENNSFINSNNTKIYVMSKFL